MGRRERYISVEKYNSVPGLVSILMGAGTVIGILILFVLSYLNQGNAGIWIGVAGLLLIAVAFAAIVVAITGFWDPEALHTRPTIGLIENMIIFILLVLLYISGM